MKFLTLVTAAAALLSALPALAAPQEKVTVEPHHRQIIKVRAISGEDGEERVIVTSSDGDAVRMAHPLLQGGGYLGISMLDITPELRRHFGAPEDAGVLISRVDEESPAAAAGLAAGDVLTAVDGEAVASPRGVMRRMLRKEADDVVSLEIIRDGRRESFEAALAERPRARIDLAPMVWGWDGERAGMPTLQPGTFESVIEIDEDSLSALRERLESSGLHDHIRRFGERHHGLEDRLHELEERLEELEAELEKARD